MLCALPLLGAVPLGAYAAEARPTAVLLFLPSSSDAIETELAEVPTLSTGLLSATQGDYTTVQLLLDITQGARVSYSAYSPPLPPTLSLLPTGPRSSAKPPGSGGGAGSKLAQGGVLTQGGEIAGASNTTGGREIAGGAQVTNWPRVLRRANGAPQILQPGLLAAAIPGGAAYAGITGANHADGVLAADRSGHIAAVSLGPPANPPTRVTRLSRRYALVVADLPEGSAGEAQLRLLARERPPNQLLLVIQRAPNRRGYELLWSALAGLGGGHVLTSSTTNQQGLTAAIDIAPTILRHLALPIPAAMRGQPVRTDGSFDGAHLRALKARLEVLYSRRLPALAWLLVAWALLLLASLVPLTRGDPTRRWASPVAIQRGDPARHRTTAMRVGALAMLWTPAAELLPAALQPSRSAEYAILVLACFALGFLSDRLLPWPRAPLAPALAAIVALSADALLHTQLLIRSLLGPNPIYGARFYGIGNELKSALAVLVFAAVAALLYPSTRGRRAAAAMALAGIALAVVEGSARIGAGVGGVILVSAGTAVATLVLLPGRLTRRRALIVLVAPAAGLVVLAGLDFATAHGSGHFTGSILHARSAGDLRDVIQRRYAAAYEELKHGAMPLATALALLGAVLGAHRRRRLLASVAEDPAWLAALAGGLTAGVIGALTEDSGPVLLVVAVFALLCVLGYLWGRPPERPLLRAYPGRGVRLGRSRVERSADAGAKAWWCQVEPRGQSSAKAIGCIQACGPTGIGP